MNTLTVFDLLWRTLADILGTAATATLIRRAARRAAARFPELHDLTTHCDGREYKYTLPARWSINENENESESENENENELAASLRELARELCSLLVELTGPVVMQRLATEPALRALVIPLE